MTAILKDLELESLQERRRQSRLILFCKGVFQQAKLPTDVLQEPTRRTKNMHNIPFRQLTTNSDTYKNSFMPRTIRDWNSVPKQGGVPIYDTDVGPGGGSFFHTGLQVGTDTNLWYGLLKWLTSTWY